MTHSKTTSICVYGAASSTIDQAYLSAGAELGKGIARRGWRLVFGAGATGMMGAVLEGVKEENGKTAGVAPTFFDEPGVLADELDDLLLVSTMRERKAFMESFASAFVMTPGGIGTLEEFYEILVLKQLGQLDAPIALLNTENFFTPLLEAMKSMEDKRFISSGTFRLFEVFDSPNSLLSWLDTQLTSY